MVCIENKKFSLGVQCVNEAWSEHLSKKLSRQGAMALWTAVKSFW